MKKLPLTILLAALAFAAHAAATDYAYRLPAEIQTPGPAALPELTWQQGTTPLIQVDVLRRGRPVDADTNTTVRMIIGQSATNTYYVLATNTASMTTGTAYYVQWPTVGTNSHGTNAAAQAWWYTIYFEADGHRYWTGNGDLYIEETTSTAEDGLTWQTIVTGDAAWADITGKPTSIAGYAITDAYTKAESDAAYAPTGAVDNLASVSSGVDIVIADLAAVSGAVDIAAGDLASVSNALNTSTGNVGVVSNALNTVTGNVGVVSNLAAAAYPASNPSNWVTASVTDGLYSASNPSNFVTASVTDGLYSASNPSNFVTASVTDGLYSASNPSNYYPASNPSNWVDASVTDGLYSASNPSGFLDSAESWSEHTATTNVRLHHKVTTNVVTNLVVTGTLTPDVTGTYAYVSENNYQLGSWRVYEKATDCFWLSDVGESFAWENSSPTIDGEYTAVINSTGTAYVAYSIITNSVTNTIFISGTNGTNIVAAGGPFEPQGGIYMGGKVYTNLLSLGTGATDAYPGDAGGAVSNLAAAAYPASNPSNFVDATVTDGVETSKVDRAGETNVLNFTAAVLKIADGLETNEPASVGQLQAGIEPYVLTTTLAAHTNNESADIQHLTAAEKAIATNPFVSYAGVVYTITNDPATAGDLLYFNPSNSNAWFDAAPAGLTLDAVKNAEPLMTNSTSVAIGKLATASTYGAAQGYKANGSYYGAAQGHSANGNNCGAAQGYKAAGNNYGAAQGYKADGNNYGVAQGAYADGINYGVAQGAYANAPYTNIAIGAYANAEGGVSRTSIGARTTNDIDNSTRVRGALYLDGGTQIFTRATFGSGAFTPLATGGGAAPAADTYPVFHLPMGSAWTDFELKASTNNFESMVFFHISAGTNTYSWGDTNIAVYFTCDYADDVRKWIRATNGVSIFEQVTAIHSNAVINDLYVFPSHDCMVPWADWMQKTNNRLVWSWVRFDGLDFEKNYDGTKQRWNLIRPQSWEAERTTP